MTTDRRRC